MKTQGIEVASGYLIHQGINDIPDAFWARLKHEASKKQLLDGLKGDWAAEVAPEHGPGKVYAEHRLFQDWVRTLLGEPPRVAPFNEQLWPWTCGWTETAVDTYLTQPFVAQEAA